MNIFSTINSGIIFINTINQFLRRSVGGVNEKDFVQHSNKTITRKQTMSSNSRLDFVNTNTNLSARQNSVRGLFQESVLNSTNRQHKQLKNANLSLPINTLQMKQRIQQDQSQRKQQKIKPISKSFLFIWTISLVFILAVLSSYLIIDQTGTNLNLVKSVKNLLLILNKQISFSSIVISYLDLYSNFQTNSSKFPSDTTLFNDTYKRFYEIDNMQPIFDEVNFPQFANFTTLFQQVNYQYICSYMHCESKFESYVNIIYNSAVERFDSQMGNNIKSSSIGSEIQFQIQLLFYAHYMLQNTIYTLLKSYISDYDKYTTFKYVRIYMFYYLQIVAFIIFVMIAIIFFCCHFQKEKKKHAAILQLVKKESYQIKQISQT